MKKPSRTSTDHRTRVAAERRLRMRAHLFDATLRLMAEKPPDAIAIDDVVQAAGVARGTFYNYFTTPIELVRAVGAELTEDLITTVDLTLRAHRDPAERVAVGQRMILKCARASPLLASVIMHSGWPVAATDHALHRLTARDIAAGLKSGRFRPVALEAAMALLGGLTVGVMPAYASRSAPPELEDQVAETLLLGLGLPSKEAAKLGRAQIVQVSAQGDGILARLLSVDASGSAQS